MDRKLLVVNNATSGGRNKNQRVVRAFKSMAESNSLIYQLLETSIHEGAESMVSSQSENEFTDLVIIGGDGTINEAVNGLKFDKPVTIISAGTGNDFVKNLPYGKSMEQQLNAVVNGQKKKIDIGTCNGRKFMNGVGIGFDGQIVHEMLQKKIPFLKGHAKYYYHVLSILASYKKKPFQYSLNEENREDELILMTIGNGTTFGGGFKLMPDAKIDDGLLDVCTIGPLAGWKRFFHIGKLSNGTHGKLGMVSFSQTTAIAIEANPALYAHADGEAIGSPPFHIQVLPSAVTLRV